MIEIGGFWIEIFLLVAGFFIGSFINVIIYRLPRGQSIISPRSRCPQCEHRLGAVELIPIFSYIFLKGKCRECGEKISLRYPSVEFLTGLLFVLNWIFKTSFLEFVAGLFLITLMLPMIFIDLDHQILPDKLTITGAISGFILSFIRPEITPLMSISGALAGGASLLFVAIVSRGGMGGGDIKLLMFSGAFLGPLMALVSIFLGAFLGLLISIPNIVRGELGLKSRLPFGPFLIMSALILWLWGAELMDLYWQVVIF